MVAFEMSPLFLLTTILVSAIAGGLVAQPILELLIRTKSRQTVSAHVPEHAGKQGTPTMGGLIILAGFFGGMAYTFFQLRSYPGEAGRPYFLAFSVLILAFGAIGFLDDYVVPRMIKGKRGLGWTQKLALQILCAFLFEVLMGRTMNPWQAGFGIFLILFFSNAYNFSDGMDTLAGLLLLGMGLGLAMFAYGKHETGLYPIIGSFIGATLPFLWLNKSPAKVFMGDVGSLPIGAGIGAMYAALILPEWSVHLLRRTDLDFSASVPVTWVRGIGLFLVAIVMFIELVPVPIQILSVKLRKKRVFPMTPIHHAFQKAGWLEMRVVGLFVSVQLVASIIGGAMWLGSRPKLPEATNESFQDIPGGEFKKSPEGFKPIPNPGGPGSGTIK